MKDESSALFHILCNYVISQVIPAQTSSQSVHEKKKKSCKITILFEENVIT